MGTSNLISVGTTLQDLRRAVQKLASLKLNADSAITFGSITLDNLTANRLTYADADKLLSSVADLTTWVAGTTNQISIADDGDGSITLSTPQDIHTGASPTFAGLTILSPAPILVFQDSNSLGAASIGYIEWRDSGGGRAGFLGNNSSGNDDLYWKNEQGGNIGIETTGAGEFQIFANTVIPDDGYI
ncbi:hypothetical protein LCGC14_2023770, partial [marine sediment metagenome]